MSPIITLVEGWGTPWQRMAIVENKDRLIDKNPNFLNYQKPEIKNEKPKQGEEFKKPPLPPKLPKAPQKPLKKPPQKPNI